MPPRKQYPVTQIFRLSRLEAETLKFLGGPRGASDVFRTALLYYMQHSGTFDMAAFKKHVKANLAPKLGPEAREHLKTELDDLERDLASSAKSESLPIDADLVSEWLSGKE